MCRAKFTNSTAVFLSLLEGLKGHEKRPKIYQMNANLKVFNWMLKFLKSISCELNAEVGKIRHQKKVFLCEGFLPPSIPCTVLILLGRPLMLEGSCPFNLIYFIPPGRFHPKLNPKLLLLTINSVLRTAITGQDFYPQVIQWP